MAGAAVYVAVPRLTLLAETLYIPGARDESVPVLVTDWL
jgi:hypothetical protein